MANYPDEYVTKELIRDIALEITEEKDFLEDAIKAAGVQGKIVLGRELIYKCHGGLLIKPP
jgi:hypothetical protein